MKPPISPRRSKSVGAFRPRPPLRLRARVAAVTEALDASDMPLDEGRLAGLWFLRATARRAETGSGRRVDLTFRALVDLG